MANTIAILKNMPNIESRWLACAGMCKTKDIQNMKCFNTLSTKEQNMIMNKYRAARRAVLTEKWGDLSMITICDAHKDIFMEMSSAFMNQDQNGETLLELLSSSNEDVGTDEKCADEKCADEKCADEKCADEQTQPVWYHKRWARVCRCFQNGGLCPHQSQGKICSFAHSIEQLMSNVQTCPYGKNCYHWCSKSECGDGKRPCERLHPGETVSDLVNRLELQVSLPDKCVEHIPVKARLATESEDLKNLLFKAQAHLIAVHTRLSEETVDIDSLKQHVQNLLDSSTEVTNGLQKIKNMSTANNSRTQPKLTIDIDIANASTPISLEQ